MLADARGPGRLHFASYYRWLILRDWLKVAPTDRLLDIGCDDGEITARLRAGLRVAVDLNPRCPDPAVRLARSDATRLPVAGGQFQTVTAFDLIEHVSDDRAVLAEAMRALAPGGTLWISTPAVKWRIFPNALTARAARAFGHVRNGYTVADLQQRLPPGCALDIMYWNEPVFRLVFALLRVIDSVSSPLARLLSGWCYALDRRWPLGDGGHLFVRVRRGSA